MHQPVSNSELNAECDELYKNLKKQHQKEISLKICISIISFIIIYSIFLGPMLASVKFPIEITDTVALTWIAVGAVGSFFFYVLFYSLYMLFYYIFSNMSSHLASFFKIEQFLFIKSDIDPVDQKILLYHYYIISELKYDISLNAPFLFSTRCAELKIHLSKLCDLLNKYDTSLTGLRYCFNLKNNLTEYRKKLMRIKDTLDVNWNSTEITFLSFYLKANFLCFWKGDPFIYGSELLSMLSKKKTSEPPYYLVFFKKATIFILSLIGSIFLVAIFSAPICTYLQSETCTSSLSATALIILALTILFTKSLEFIQSKLNYIS